MIAMISVFSVLANFVTSPPILFAIPVSNNAWPTINIFYADICFINLFFYMYTGYNGTIKRNVYGLYFSGKNQMEGEYRNVSDNYHIAVSCVHHYQFHP